MSSRSDALAWIFGVTIILIGLSLIGSAVWLYYTPMEEPASPGKTPNPSEVDRDIDRIILLLRIRLYAVPVAGLLLVGLGAWLLTADHRRRGTP